jgi:hypothetical protein
VRAAEAPTIEDVLALVRAIAAPGRRAEALEEEARRIVERAGLARRHRAATGQAHPDFGDGSLSAAAGLLRRSTPHRARLTTWALLRAGAAVCHVLSIEAPEPQVVDSEPRARGAKDTGGAASKTSTLRS